MGVSSGKTLHKKKAVRDLQRDYAATHGPGPEIAFLLQDWTDAYNVGGMFRVADALGATELVLTGKTPTLPNPMIPVTSMGAHRRVSWRHEDDHEAAALAMKEAGYMLIAVEIAEGAVSYREFEWPEKICLVMGSEQRGVYGRVMRHVEASVFIPMAGKGRSLNVHVAAAVVGFHARGT